jgi:hypothetical protein
MSRLIVDVHGTPTAAWTCEWSNEIPSKEVGCAH